MQARTSALSQAEASVNVRIRRPEPVAERGPYETSRRSRGSPFQNVVLIVEERLRVVAVERKRFEIGKWSEGRGGPFPPVAIEIESRGHRRRIPVTEIEISVLGRRRQAGESMKFGLGNQPLAAPSGVGFGFYFG